MGSCGEHVAPPQAPMTRQTNVVLQQTDDLAIPTPADHLTRREENSDDASTNMTDIRSEDTLQQSERFGRTALEAFLSSVELRTTDATHKRLLKVARNANPAAALELELAKVMEELLRED